MVIEEGIAVSIIIGSVTILLSVGLNAFGKYQERKKEVEAELREKKLPVYTKIFDFFYRLFMGGNEQVPSVERMENDEIIESLSDISDKLMIWGSDEVIHKWTKLRLKLANPDEDSESEMREIETSSGTTEVPEMPEEQLKENMFLVEDLFIAIRKDLGYSGRKINRGDILGMFVNDIKGYVDN